MLDCYTQALASNAPLDPTIMLRCSLLLACVAAMAPASTKKRPPKDDPRQRKTPGLFDSVERPGIDLRQKPEVMAPAGGWPQLRAAVNNGADAVYFGLSTFSARARAGTSYPRLNTTVHLQRGRRRVRAGTGRHARRGGPGAVDQ